METTPQSDAALPTPPAIPPSSSIDARLRSAWPRVLLAALVIAHFAWICAHFEPAYNSPDANGYFAQARLIATQGTTGMKEESVVQYFGMHWLDTRNGTRHSRYPAGFPLLVAIAYKLGGPAAGLMVNPVLASATLLIVFALTRRFAGGWGALLATAVVATTAITNQHALNFGSHIASMFFLLGGATMLVSFAEDPARWRRGLAAGFLLGALPSMRYPEAICAIAVAVYLVWRVRPWWRAWPAVLGAAIPLVVLLAHNQIAYGAFWKTGYALTGEQTGFSWAYFAAHAFNYLRELGSQGALLFFGLGVAGLAALAASRRRRAEGFLFAGTVVPILAVYMAYYWGGGGAGPGGGGPGGPGGGAGGVTGGLRFLIPIIPFFALGGAYLLFEVLSAEKVVRRAVIAVVLLLQLSTGLFSSQVALRNERASTKNAADARHTLERLTPAGSVLVANNALADGLDYTGRWKLADAALLNAGAGLGRMRPGGMPPPGAQRPMRGGPPEATGGFGPPAFGSDAMMGPPPDAPGGEAAMAPSPMQPGRNRERMQRYAGLSADARVATVWSDIRAWAGSQPIFWIGNSLDVLRASLPPDAGVENIGELPAPVGFRPGGPGMRARNAGNVIAAPPGPGFAGADSGASPLIIARVRFASEPAPP